MESRVMGNCHARFGAGENPEERICSLRLHIPRKGLPIAIRRPDRSRDVPEEPGRDPVSYIHLTLPTT